MSNFLRPFERVGIQRCRFRPSWLYPRFGTAHFRITYLMPTLMMRPRGCKKMDSQKGTLSMSSHNFGAVRLKKGFSSCFTNSALLILNSYLIFLVGLKMVFKWCKRTKNQYILGPIRKKIRIWEFVIGETIWWTGYMIIKFAGSKKHLSPSFTTSWFFISFFSLDKISYLFF